MHSLWEENNDADNFCRNCGAPLNSSQMTIHKNMNIFERFRNANILIKLMAIVVVVFIILYIAGATSYIFLGTPLDSYSEEAECKNLVDFNAIDMDSDGALTFDEADGYAPEVASDDLTDIFDEADSNHNGLLKGGEFDWNVHKIKEYNKDLKKQKNDDEKSSSSSNSIPTVHLGKCPSCGSDAEYMYDYYDEFGRPYYQCSVCDYWTYEEGEFYGINYIITGGESHGKKDNVSKVQ